MIQISLVAHKDKLYLAASIVSDFLQPFPDVIKGDFPGDVINQDSSDGTPVVTSGDGFK